MAGGSAGPAAARKAMKDCDSYNLPPSAIYRRLDKKKERYRANPTPLRVSKEEKKHISFHRKAVGKAKLALHGKPTNARSSLHKKISTFFFSASLVFLALFAFSSFSYLILLYFLGTVVSAILAVFFKRLHKHKVQAILDASITRLEEQEELNNQEKADSQSDSTAYRESEEKRIHFVSNPKEIRKTGLFRRENVSSIALSDVGVIFVTSLAIFLFLSLVFSISSIPWLAAIPFTVLTAPIVLMIVFKRLDGRKASAVVAKRKVFRKRKMRKAQRAEEAWRDIKSQEQEIASSEDYLSSLIEQDEENDDWTTYDK